MPPRAKLYIGSIITVGFTLLAGCLLFAWEFPDLPRYLSYLLLSCVASALKIRLPNLRGTMSVNFVFILIGLAQMTAAETITLGCAGALMQSFWKPRKPPTLIQVLFNISALVTSIAVSFSVSQALDRRSNLTIRMSVAVCAFFMLNSVIVSLVLSLTERQSLSGVWRQCYLWAFPYYLVGAAIASAITVSSRSTGWLSSLLILPLMYMVYTYYRIYLAQQVQPADLAPVVRKKQKAPQPA